MANFTHFDCPECDGKETVRILPTAGGRGTGEATSYGAMCQACNRMLAEELPSNCDGKRATATREFKRILARWPEEMARAPRIASAVATKPNRSAVAEERALEDKSTITLAGIAFERRGLLERAMRNLRTMAPRRGEVRSVLVGRLFGTGSTVSAALCREFGYDPEEKVWP